MSTKEAAERACKEPNPIIDGRKANVNLAILGAKPRGNALQSECSQNSLNLVKAFLMSSRAVAFAGSFVFVP